MRKTKEQFIKEANIIHGNKYDYSKVTYSNNNTKIEIICHKHGSFYSTPKNHLNGYNCSVCTGKLKLTIESFIEKSIAKHGTKYDYSKTIYKDAFTQVIIICPQHGEFKTVARNHYYKGYGCKKCGYKNPHNRLNNDDFLQRANIVHDNKYDYSEVVYKSSNKKVTIICKKHGKFKQQAGVHLAGHGCRYCSSSTGEKFIRQILIDKNLEFDPQHKFQTCINPLTKRKLRFDFYLPEYNMCLEYDGKQHFEPVKYWGGSKKLEIIKYRDQIKTDYCQNNNISLLRINYKEDIEQVLINCFLTAQTISVMNHT